MTQKGHKMKGEKTLLTSHLLIKKKNKTKFHLFIW